MQSATWNGPLFEYLEEETVSKQAFSQARANLNPELDYTRKAGFSFVMRVREKWNLQADSIKSEGWIRLSLEGEDFSVRVLKVSLPSGKTETLLTNLDENQLYVSQTAQLYFRR